MVSFQEDPENYNTTKMMTYLDDQITKVAGVEKKLKTIDELIAVTPAYVQKVRVTNLRGDICAYHSISDFWA
jgi:trehalose-6-phosphate synthase